MNKKEKILIVGVAVIYALLLYLFINAQVIQVNSQKELVDIVGRIVDNQIKMQNKVESVSSEVYKMQKELDNTKIKLESFSKYKKTLDNISRGSIDMRATAYDLTVKSCGKRKSHPEYGITRTGTKATVGRTVAVDPKFIPLKSRLYIEFPSKYKYLDGVYIAEDTGSAVKGNIIDIFLGENESEVDIFGIQKVKVYIIGR